MSNTFLLIGPPGSGKTTAACTAPPPILIVDAECKADKMLNISHLIKDGTVTIMPVREKLVADRLSKRALNPDKAPEKQPMGYIATVDILNNIIDDKEEYKKYNTIVLDSLSQLEAHLRRLLIFHQGTGKIESGRKRDSDPGWPSWGLYLNNLEECFQEITQIEKTFIYIAHQYNKTVPDDSDKTGQRTIDVKYLPKLFGQLRDSFGRFFSDVYYLDKNYSNSFIKDQYWFRTMGTKYEAKTSFLDVPELIEPNIMNLIKNYSSPAPKTEQNIQSQLKTRRK